MVRLILDHGAPVDSTDATGKSALMIAAAIGKADMVKILLQSGAEVGLRDLSGATALDWAGRKGRDEILAILRSLDALGTVTEKQFLR